jgi:hypothetical protein
MLLINRNILQNIQLPKCLALGYPQNIYIKNKGLSRKVIEMRMQT